MMEQCTFSPEEEAQISMRINQTFNFLLDVINDPMIVEEVPSGSKLRFLDLEIDSTQFHLVAYEDTMHAGRWIARITAPAETVAAQRILGNALTEPEDGDSADAALDALAQKLRRGLSHPSTGGLRSA